MRFPLLHSGTLTLTQDLQHPPRHHQSLFHAMAPRSQPTAFIIASASLSPFSRWINALEHLEPSKGPSPHLLQSLKEKEKTQAVHCDKPC